MQVLCNCHAAYAALRRRGHTIQQTRQVVQRRRVSLLPPEWPSPRTRQARARRGRVAAEPASSGVLPARLQPSPELAHQVQPPLVLGPHLDQLEKQGPVEALAVFVVMTASVTAGAPLTASPAAPRVPDRPDLPATWTVAVRGSKGYEGRVCSCFRCSWLRLWFWIGHCSCDRVRATRMPKVATESLRQMATDATMVPVSFRLKIVNMFE